MNNPGYILDGGVETSEGLANYSPQLRFYALYWERYGITTQSLTSADAARPGTPIATCDPSMIAAIADIAGAVPILQDEHCLAVILPDYAGEN